jgi:glycosyltransferase involved in cell wall biosynthesis
MHVSIVIASYNEGRRLSQTVHSCLASIRTDLKFEIVVADDGSTDGSADQVMGLPFVKVVRNQSREGPAGGKDLGARHAIGKILVFLDAHCKPEVGAIEKLASDVAIVGGQSVVAPRIAVLDIDSWQNRLDHCGNGIALNLGGLEEQWVPLKTLRRYRSFYVSPNLAGSCLAVTRSLYFELGGFDRQMRSWGSEHSDFGLKAWLSGHRVLNDIDAVVGHRFQGEIKHYPVPPPQILANQLRLARKHFSDPLWADWLPRFQVGKDPDVWGDAWRIFAQGSGSLESERAELSLQRVHDEFWYADEFGMNQGLGLTPCSAGRKLHQLRLRASHSRASSYGDRIIESDLAGKAVAADESVVEIFLKIGSRLWGGPYVENAAFACRGSPLIGMYASLLTELIQGRTLEIVRCLAADDLQRRIGADESEKAAAELAVRALHNALRDALVSETSRTDEAGDFEACVAQVYEGQ